MVKLKTLQFDKTHLIRSGYEPVQPSDATAQAAPSNGVDYKGTADTSVAHQEDELWTFKTVVARTGLSRSSIYSYIAQGLFPRQRRLGLRRGGRLASEVRAWIRSRPT